MKKWSMKKNVLICVMFLLAFSQVFAGGKSESKANNQDPVFNKTGLPITNEMITFTIVYEQHAQSADFGDMEFFKELEKQTNIHIEWEALPEGTAKEQKNLIIASGSLPDAFMLGGETLTPQELVKYSREKIFIPLDEYLPTYAPNFNALLNSRRDIKKIVTTPEGHIYAFPKIDQQGAFRVYPTLFINKVWLDKLNLAIPVTVDDFYNVLIAFKTQDPNENGIQDEVPYAFCSQMFFADIGPLFGSFGFAPEFFSQMVVEDGKVIWVPTTDGYKNAINYFHKYFEEGLMDAEGFTIDVGAWFGRNRGPETLLGSFIDWTGTGPVGVERSQEYIPLSPLAGPGGHRSWPEVNLTNNDIRQTGFSITTSCDTPEILIRWADLFMEKKMASQAFWGPIGISLEENSDGTLVRLPPPEGKSADDYAYEIAPVSCHGLLLEEDYDNYIPRLPSNKAKIEMAKKYYEPYMTSATINDIFMTQEESEIYNTLRWDLEALTFQKRAEWLLNGNIDEDWDDYIKTLERMGLSKYLNTFQATTDRYNSN